MDTVVIQSFRRTDVPPWVTRCLQSVEQWAAARGYDYRFVGDEIFELVPPAYFARTSHAMTLVVDLGRLILAQRALAEGYQRAIWVDADVIVIDPAAFDVPRDRDFTFNREIWLELVGGVFELSKRVNNCVCMFAAGTSFLAFYIDAIQQLIRDAVGALDPILASTIFLTQLDRIVRLPQLQNVGLFAPQAVLDAAHGGGVALELLAAQFGVPFAAANLGTSFRGRRFKHPAHPPFVLDDDVYARAIDHLLRR